MIKVTGCIYWILFQHWNTISDMDGRPSSGASSSRWLWIVPIWFGIGLFDASQTVFTMRAAGMHHAWVRLFFTLLFAWVPLALATPIILELGRNFSPFRRWAFSAWVIHAIASCAICLIASAWIAGFELILNPWAEPSGPGSYGGRVWFRFFGGADFVFHSLRRHSWGRVRAGFAGPISAPANRDRAIERTTFPRAT